MILSRPCKSVCWITLLLLAGCQKQSLRSQNPDDDEIQPKKTPFIGDQVTISGLHPIQIETVGLVTNLDGTGGDTPPSLWRTMLVNEMRKRGVKNPNTLLQSPTAALVLVRAMLPPVLEKGDRFDIEVVLRPNSEASSLKGGFLMECGLAEQAIVPGQGPKSGHILARAEGPIMLSASDADGPSAASLLKRGRVLGG